MRFKKIMTRTAKPAPVARFEKIKTRISPRTYHNYVKQKPIVTSANVLPILNITEALRYLRNVNSLRMITS